MWAPTHTHTLDFSWNSVPAHLNLMGCSVTAQPPVIVKQYSFAAIGLIALLLVQGQILRVSKVLIFNFFFFLKNCINPKLRNLKMCNRLTLSLDVTGWVQFVLCAQWMINALKFLSYLVGLSASNDYSKSVKFVIHCRTNTLFLLVYRWVPHTRFSFQWWLSNSFVSMVSPCGAATSPTLLLCVLPYRTVAGYVAETWEIQHTRMF